MNRRLTIALSLSALVYAMSSAAIAQSAPPSYKASPDVYKVIYQNQYFRVIMATWRKGQRDKPHSHSLQAVIYNLTDCTLRITSKDGKSRVARPKIGEAHPGHIVSSHFAENIGPTECRLLFVERK